jgi:hypothetical protein
MSVVFSVVLLAFLLQHLHLIYTNQTTLETIFLQCVYYNDQYYRIGRIYDLGWKRNVKWLYGYGFMPRGDGLDYEINTSRFL